MLHSLRTKILIIISVIVLGTIITTVFLVQKETEKILFDTENAHAHNLVNTVLLNIENEHQNLNHHKRFTLEKKKQGLKDIVSSGYSLVENYYNQHKQGKLPESEAKKRARDAIRSIRYGNESGYLWINDTGTPVPRMLTHPTMPELEGQIPDSPRFNCVVNSDKNLLAAFRDICLDQGDGFVEYTWPKPTKDGFSSPQPKVSYVRLFKEWNWIIGTGVYIDDIEGDASHKLDTILLDLKQMISNVTISESGYLYIVSGKKEILVHPSLEGMDSTLLINPMTKNNLVDELITAANSGTGVFEYLWDRPDRKGEFLFPKRGYVRYYKPLDWYICASVYLDEIKQPARAVKKKIFRVSLILLAIAIIFSIFLSASLTTPLKNLVRAANQIKKYGIETAEIPVEGSVETRELGMVLGKMIQSIKENRERYQKVLEETVDAYYEVDIYGNFTFCNKAWEKILGVHFEELIGLNYGEFIDKETKKKVHKVFHQVFTTGEPVRMFDYTAHIKDGTTMHLETSVALLRDQGGVPIGFSGFARDISHSKKIEDLNEARKDAEAANLAKSDFLANMSHEIRTPLNGIIGYAEMMLKSESLKQCHSQAGTILKESEHLLELINEILDHAKIEAGKLELEYLPVDLRHILETVISISLVTAREKGLNLTIESSENAAQYVMGDALRLRQVLLNLVNNALKFTEEGSVSLSIDAVDEIANNKQKLKFSVADTGIGIPEDKQKTIFESFTQVDQATTRKYGGTGLGTTISYQLVKLMGGELQLFSKTDKGSLFSFIIEFELAASINAAEEFKAVELMGETAQTTASATILLAEDYPVNQEVARHHLEDAGHRVAVVENGQQAVDLCRIQKFDIILMDVQMPVLDGLDATRLIRAGDSPNSGTIIMALTANADKISYKKCIAAGMNEVLTKPIKKKTLIEGINVFLSPVKEGEAGHEPKHGSSNAESEFTPPLDFITAEEEFGDIDVVKQVASNLLKNIEVQIKTMDDGIVSNDMETLRREAHAIKGGAGTIEAHPLADAAKTIEAMCEQGNTDVIREQLNILVAEFQRLKAYLKNHSV